MSDITTKHYIINYNDITNIPFIDIDTEKLQVINNKLTTIYEDTNLTQGKNIDISFDGFISVANTFINDNDINKIYYNGNVGIGTTNPTSLLNIYDSINSSNLLNISENGLLLDTNINVEKNTIEIGSSASKINKINCNFLNNIDTSFLTEDNLINNIFYTRTTINATIADTTTTNRAYTTEIFTNSSNYTNQEIAQVTIKLETYSDTQISMALNNSSNYSEELFTNSSNYNTELFTNSSNYGEELSINSSNYIDKEITRVSGDVIINAFDTNIITELPSLKITGTYTNTQLLEQLAEKTTGYDGWKLVRFLPDGSASTFSSTDNLVGTDIYGDSSDFTSEWSIEFQSGGYDEYLFVGGNFVDWLILNKSQFIPLDGTNNKVIDAIKSSVNPNPHTVKAGTEETDNSPLIALTEWEDGKHLYEGSCVGRTLEHGDGTYAERPYYIFVRNSADKYSSVNIIGNIANASGIILKSDVNSEIDYKSFIILKSANGNVNEGIKIYNYEDDNLLISTNKNDKTAPTVILNERKMILGYNTSEYFTSPRTNLYNSPNTLEIKGDININGNLKKNNEIINLNVWSTQSNNMNYIEDIIFKDLEPLSNTAYVQGSLVTITGNLSLNKQGLIIEKSDRTQRIGITDCSIKQLGSNANAKLSIISKGNLPVSIGNETNNTLQIYENRALLSGDSGGATELCALSLINSRQGAIGTACSLGFNLSNEWDHSVKINAICTNATNQAADLIFNTHNGTSLTEKMRILANGDIKFTGDLYQNNGLFTSYTDANTSNYLNNLDTHIIPITNEAFDIGSVDKKIRDIYVSNNSIWIGDSHKMMVSGEKITFKKRNKNIIPSKLVGIVSDNDIQTRFSKDKSNLSLSNWLVLAKETLPTGNSIQTINDIFEDNDDNYDESANMDSWLSSNNNIYLHGDYENLGIGIATPDKKLHVNGDIKFTGDLYYNDSLFETTHLSEGTNLYYTDVRVDTRLTNKTTNDISEGTTNLYYTDARVDTRLTNKTTNDISEGTTNLYYTDARVDTRLTNKTTNDISEGTTNLYYTDTRVDTRLTNKTTNDISEGTTNLYYTDARVDTNILSKNIYSHNTNVGIGNNSPSYKLDVNGDIKFTGDLYYNDSLFETTHLSEGTNLYYTDVRVDTRLTNKTTNDISEGTTNLYYTDTRVDTRLTNKTTNDISEGTTNLYYTDTRVDTRLTNKTTNDISEGTTNLYYTDARVDTNILSKNIYSHNTNVGIGTTTPNYKLDVNGDINFTGNLTKGGNPFTSYSDTDVRALLNSGNVGIGTSTPNYKLDVNGDINFTGNLTKGGNPFTSYSDTDVRALLNSGNVGIGTSTPNYKLDVNGDINFTGNLTKTISTDPVIVPNVSINDNGSFKTVIFENTGDEQTIYAVHFPKDTICDILLIGGGGGGGGGNGGGCGGGGGAGGLIYKTNQTLSGTYNILVGKGGFGMEYSSTTMVNNNNGRDSGIYDSSDNVLYLTKGGGAGGARVTNGASGGSGGGGGGGNSSAPGTGALPINSDPYIHSIGNSGGHGNIYAKGGGGGGAGGQGSLATGSSAASGAAGNGGLPKIVDITGENRAYAGGGGGGAWQVAPGEGGSVVIDGQNVKVGGDGGYNAQVTVPGNGVPHTGSGGGGAKHFANLGTSQNAGNGGSGIVIIRYLSTTTETIEIESYSDDKVENILANLDTHIVPSVDETIDIGSIDNKIRDIYVNKLDVTGDINFAGNLTKGGNPFTSYSDTDVRALLNTGITGDIKTDSGSGFQIGSSTRLYKDHLDFNYNGVFNNWGSVRWGCGSFQSGSYGRLYLATIPSGTSLPYATGPMMRFDCHEYLYVSKKVYATGFSSTSDLRMKKNINNINSDESLNKILQLSPISYDFIDENKGTKLFGFVAQDLINIIPEAVTTRGGYLPTIMKSFKYELNKIFINEEEILNKIDVNKYYAIGNSQLDSFTPYKILEKDSNSITIENPENNSFGEETVYIYGECSNDINTINYTHISVLNSGSIQELNKKIVSLEDKIESQEILINNLINRIEKLESIN